MITPLETSYTPFKPWPAQGDPGAQGKTLGASGGAPHHMHFHLYQHHMAAYQTSWAQGWTAKAS